MRMKNLLFIFKHRRHDLVHFIVRSHAHGSGSKSTTSSQLLSLTYCSRNSKGFGRFLFGKGEGGACVKSKGEW